MGRIKIMKHYKNKSDEVYAYETDGSQDHLIPKDFIAITNDEAKTLTTKASDGEMKLNLLRKQRNSKLLESDWMANSDVTMSDAWKKYRQELRDITKTYKSLEDVKWPTAPKE